MMKAAGVKLSFLVSSFPMFLESSVDLVLNNVIVALLLGRLVSCSVAGKKGNSGPAESNLRISGLNRAADRP